MNSEDQQTLSARLDASTKWILASWVVLTIVQSVALGVLGLFVVIRVVVKLLI